MRAFGCTILLCGLLVAGSARAQSNVYVSSFSGHDILNTGCSDSDPLRTLGAAFAAAQSTACGGAPWRINMFAGSTFVGPTLNPGPITIPANMVLYWYRQPGNPPVVLDTTAGLITIAASTGSLTSTTGIDGSAAGATARPIQITGPSGVLISASGGFTNSCLI